MDFHTTLRMDFKNKKVVIMGLGSYAQGSGIAAARFFARAQAKVLVTDIKPKAHFANQLNALAAYRNIQYVFGRHKDADFKNADYIIKNPDVPKSSPYLAIARRHGVPVHNDWSIFLSVKDNPLIGVTGTRGKTTTTTLLDAFLKEHYQTFLCGNMGISPLAAIEKIKPDDVVVAELSSWNLQQFPTVKKSPHIAVITNLLVDHLNKYKNISQYYRDKEYIFAYQSADDFLVVNRDNAELKKRVKRARSRVFWFSTKPFRGEGVYVKNGSIYLEARLPSKLGSRASKLRICRVSDIKLKGAHNLENALAAICAAMIAHVSPAHIKKVLRTFAGVPNRLELVRAVGGVKYYNDTTATMPDATIAALRALDSRRVILLAGGTDKKLEYKEFAKEVKKYKPRLILFAGTATDKILNELGIKNYELRKNHDSLFLIHHSGMKVAPNVQSMKDALTIARKIARRGDIVLLSPGAASFGIFKNEFDRGEQFCKIVSVL